MSETLCETTVVAGVRDRPREGRFGPDCRPQPGWKMFSVGLLALKGIKECFRYFVVCFIMSFLDVGNL